MAPNAGYSHIDSFAVELDTLIPGAIVTLVVRDLNIQNASWLGFSSKILLKEDAYTTYVI